MPVPNLSQLKNSWMMFSFSWWIVRSLWFVNDLFILINKRKCSRLLEDYKREMREKKNCLIISLFRYCVRCVRVTVFSLSSYSSLGCWCFSLIKKLCFLKMLKMRLKWIAICISVCVCVFKVFVVYVMLLLLLAGWLLYSFGLCVSHCIVLVNEHLFICEILLISRSLAALFLFLAVILSFIVFFSVGVDNCFCSIVRIVWTWVCVVICCVCNRV